MADRLYIHKRPRQEAGSCNFCDRPHEAVYEVKGKLRTSTLCVRFCRACIRELKKGTR